MSNVVPLNGEIISPFKPKSDEQQVIDELGDEKGQQAIAICERLASEPDGLESIASNVCGMDGAHAARKFYRWRVRSPALRRMYAHACSSRAHVMVHRMMDMIEAEPDPHKARVKMDAMKWMAGKLNRADFGDEPQVGMSVTINNDAGASALDEIKQRLNRKRKQLQTSSSKSMLSSEGGGVQERRGEGVGGTPELPNHPRTPEALE